MLVSLMYCCHSADMPIMQVIDWLLGRIVGAVVDKQMHPAGRSITSRGCESQILLWHDAWSASSQLALMKWQRDLPVPYSLEYPA